MYVLIKQIYAVKKAIDQGLEENLLRDILLRQKSEVYSMLLTEFDEKKFIRTIQAEERENTLREKERADVAEKQRDEEKMRADSIQKENDRLRKELEKYKKSK